MELQLSSHFPSQNENFVNTREKLPKTKCGIFPVVGYFAWNLKFFSSIM